MSENKFKTTPIGQDPLFIQLQLELEKRSEALHHRSTWAEADAKLAKSRALSSQNRNNEQKEFASRASGDMS